MVPPLLLDVQPGQTVLDMCASPGSKTQQLLEMLEGMADPAGNAVAGRGLVVANDADEKRCHLLTSRAGKLSSTGLMVTNHDARLFPEELPRRDGGEGLEPITFDRVLCDVPCSGDGTLRKSPVIWRRWSAGPGNMLHKLQLQVARPTALPDCHMAVYMAAHVAAYMVACLAAGGGQGRAAPQGGRPPRLLDLQVRHGA